MRLFNCAGVVHSLGHEKHNSTTFQLKNNKYIVKVLKRPYGPLNYTKYTCKNIKTLSKAKLFFFLSLQRIKILFDYILKLEKPKYPYKKKLKEIFIHS